MIAEKRDRQRRVNAGPSRQVQVKRLESSRGRGGHKQPAFNAFVLFFLCCFLFNSFFLYRFLCSATGSTCHHHHPLLRSLAFWQSFTRFSIYQPLRVEAARNNNWPDVLTQRSRTSRWQYKGNHFFSQEKAGFLCRSASASMPPFIRKETV